MRDVRFTAAICTYNGADRIPDVLDCLKKQCYVDDLPWEVLVIDNNSSDSTKEVVRSYQSNWPSTSELRYLFEPRQGKVYAMRLALARGRAPLVGFLDDDNLPAEDWVYEAHEFGNQHPTAGAYGGRVHPQYEGDPPEDVEQIERVFAIVRETERFCYPPGGSFGRMFAPGAGLVIRKKAWESSVPDELIFTFGDSRLDRFEDLEIQWHMYRDGWDIWHNPSMELHHKIPDERLREKYLLSYFREHGLSRYRYRMLVHSGWSKPLLVVGYFLADGLRAVQKGWRLLRSRDRSLGTRCRLQMRIHLLAAPFVLSVLWIKGDVR